MPEHQAKHSGGTKTCYQFGGKYNTRREGRAIGLRLTGVIAKVAMHRWCRRMNDLMDEELMKIYIFTKYVDDIQIAVENTGPGVRWCKTEKRMKWKQE